MVCLRKENCGCQGLGVGENGELTGGYKVSAGGDEKLLEIEGSVCTTRMDLMLLNYTLKIGLNGKFYVVCILPQKKILFQFNNNQFSLPYDVNSTLQSVQIQCSPVSWGKQLYLSAYLQSLCLIAGTQTYTFGLSNLYLLHIHYNICIKWGFKMNPV